MGRWCLRRRTATDLPTRSERKRTQGPRSSRAMAENAARSLNTQSSCEQAVRRALWLAIGARKATECEPYPGVDAREGSPIEARAGGRALQDVAPGRLSLGRGIRLESNQYL
jgi:hypothetical protein